MQILLTGQTKAARQILAVAHSGGAMLGNGLYQEAEFVMTAAKQDFVPVDQGVLRDTGTVLPPVITDDRAEVVMGFGGPAAPYAVRQHEDLTLRHTVGQAKYLELPLKARLAGMPAVLAMRVRDGVRQAIQRLRKIEANVRAGRSTLHGMPLFRGE